MERLTFSIITVCYNSQLTIERTIQSVLDQTYTDIEYIIIDGKSADNTLSVINPYKDKVARIISEKDNGLYDAMNKGIVRASGDYILFLNADDYLFNETSITRAAAIIREDERSADVYYGNVLIFDETSGRANIWQAAKVSRFSLFRSAIPHPATFYSKEAFAKNGLFDLNYPIAADYEWMVRALLRNGLQFKRIDTLIAVFAKGGISTKPGLSKRIKAEKKQIVQEHYPAQERFYWRLRWRLRKTLGIG